MTNNRKHQRFFFEAEVNIDQEGNLQQGHAVNISAGGILIETDPVLPFGAKVILHLELPRVPETCKIPCIVRWNGEGNRVGLQFEQLRAKEVWGLNQLMHTLKSIDPLGQ